jgi:CBS-domain-containing membrane protein
LSLSKNALDQEEDVDCKTVMAPIKTSLYADDPAGTAIDFMVEKHMGLVPVTDRDGKFVGLISGDSLMKHLLPRAMSAMGGTKGGLKNASYFQESAEDMNERLNSLRDRKIGDMVDSSIRIAHPDTPLIDALMMIQDKQYVVPVVDDDDMLLGAISFFSMLYALREDYDRDAVAAAKAKEREERRKEREKSQ